MELMTTLGRPSMPAPAHAPVDAGPARKRMVGGAGSVQDRDAAFREIVSHEIDSYLISGSGSLSRQISKDETSGFGISNSANGAIAGNDIPVVSAPLAWDVRGVPPRGRPV